jgi:hypothetical protein
LPQAIPGAGSELPLKKRTWHHLHASVTVACNRGGSDRDVFFCGGPQKNLVADHAILPKLRPLGYTQVIAKGNYLPLNCRGNSGNWF